MSQDFAPQLGGQLFPKVFEAQTDCHRDSKMILFDDTLGISICTEELFIYTTGTV
jgi:hypothetical protein